MRLRLRCLIGVLAAPLVDAAQGFAQEDTTSSRWSRVWRFVYIALSILLTGTAGTAAGDELRPRIVNGVFESEQPTVGYLLSGTDPDTAFGFCSGTLIGCETFLTAAHCVCDTDGVDCAGSGAFLADPSELSVFFQHAGFSNVSSITLLPEYDFPVADFAVLKLSSPVSGISPAPINTTASPAFGTSGVISGFGTSGGSNDDVGLKRTGAMTTASCSSAGESNTTSICWNFVNPISPAGEDSNVCFGDSGAPLFVDFGAGPVVAGVASAVDPVSECLATPNTFAIDTNVFFYRSSIESAGGPDLDNTACGDLPQVGSTEVQVQGAAATVSASNPQATHTFNIPAGMQLLRVATNAHEDFAFVNDFDMFVKRGSPPTIADFDCARIGRGQLGLCEFQNPASGDWFVLVDRFSGSGAYQLTVTAFPHLEVAGGPVSGKKLLVKNVVPDDESKNRIVFLSKDPGIPIPLPGSLGDPRCGSGDGGSIQVLSSVSGQIASQVLPCENWKLLGREASPKGYKYLDKELDEGPCKLVLVKSGRLAKAVCLGKGPSTLGYDLQVGRAEDPVTVGITLGKSTTYCAEFGGAVKKDGSNGKIFLAKDSPAPTTCP